MRKIRKWNNRITVEALCMRMAREEPERMEQIAKKVVSTYVEKMKISDQKKQELLNADETIAILLQEEVGFVDFFRAWIVFNKKELLREGEKLLVTWNI